MISFLVLSQVGSTTANRKPRRKKSGTGSTEMIQQQQQQTDDELLRKVISDCWFISCADVVRKWQRYQLRSLFGVIRHKESTKWVIINRPPSALIKPKS